MRSIARLAGVLLTLAPLTLVSLVHSQVDDKPIRVCGFHAQRMLAFQREAPGGLPPVSESITLPTDRIAQKRIETALDYLKEGAWAETIRLLQALLDAEQDVFLQQEEKVAGGKTVVRWLSARMEAERMIGALPAKGREHYELTIGRLAADLLKQGQASNDPHLLAEVARRYLHTRSGVEALAHLGAHHLDRGRADLAADCFRRLLKRAPAKELSPPTLLKAAIAFRQAGDSANEEAVWQLLAVRAGGGVKVGKQPVPLERLRKELDRMAAAVPVATDWPLFRGGPTRMARGQGDIPYLEPRWHTQTAEREETRKAVGQALQYAELVKEPVLPALFPITIGNKVIFRTYAGINCVDLKSGRELWSVGSPLSFEAILRDPGKKVQLDQWMRAYGAPGLLSAAAPPPGLGIAGRGPPIGFGGGLSPYGPTGPTTGNGAAMLLFSNCTLGTLSSDRRQVYAVEDLPLPPHPDLMAQAEGGAPRHFGPLRDPVYHNRLRAIDLDTGKMVWELGGRGAGELQDAYFLGPPLPLADKLYALVDRNGELRLLCVEPERGKIAWSQPLASYRDKILIDARRRVQAAHLSHADGVLVCSTSAGTLLGFEVLTRSLLWAYAYRSKGQLHDEALPAVPIGSLGATWRTSAPIIHDGKIVFTAPDGDAVHCLRLRDGAPLWKANRADDDLYLAGILRDRVLIVGKRLSRALSFSDGKQLWQLETGLPSGQGVASGDTYFLPLQQGAVAALDAEKGAILARTESRGGEIPGNLLFHDGDLLSQTPLRLAVYPQLKVQLARIDRLLRQSPRDPVALTERGALRLDQGDLVGAVADLRAALSEQPPAELQPRTRGKLYVAMTQLLERDFSAGEKYLDEYRELCHTAVPNDLKPEQIVGLRREQERRLLAFQALLARGREQQGRFGEAIQEYQQLYDLARSDQPLTAPDDLGVKIRPDRWVQTRLANLAQTTDAARKRVVAERSAREWKEAQAGGISALERFVGLYGGMPGVGPTARLELAERLTVDPDRARFLEAELHLLQLRDDGDPAIAARAVEALARLAGRKGLFDDAFHYYRILGREFASVVVKEGKTGAELFQELATDKRLLGPFHDATASWPAGGLKASEVAAAAPPKQTQLIFEPHGEVLPSLQRQRLVLDLVSSQLRMLDTATGANLWNLKLILATPRTHLQETAQGGLRVRYHAVGHLALLSLGHQIFAVDLLDRRVLWQRKLVEVTTPNQLSIAYNPESGWEIADANTGLPLSVRLTRAGDGLLCLHSPRGLYSLDLLRGEVLWSRMDQTFAVEQFADAEHLFLVSTTGIGTRALRLRDGVSVPTADFTDAYNARLSTQGGQLLVYEPDPQGNGQVLRLHDVRAGKDVWKKAFPANSFPLRSITPRLTGAIAPDGKAVILDTATGKELLRVSVEAVYLEKVQQVSLLADSSQLYLAIHGPLDAAGGVNSEAEANFHGSRPNAPVNGMLYAFDRETGRLNWRNRTSNQLIILDRFEDLPVVLCSAWYQKVTGPGGETLLYVGTRSYDKKTGKLLYNKEMVPTEGIGPQTTLFHTLHVDPRAGTVDLIGPRVRVHHGPASAALK